MDIVEIIPPEAERIKPKDTIVMINKDDTTNWTMVRGNKCLF
jgi:hypothetical protein